MRNYPRGLKVDEEHGVAYLYVIPPHHMASDVAERTIICGDVHIDLNDNDDVVGIEFMDLSVFGEAS